MKNKYVTHKQMTTTELQAPDVGQAHTYIITKQGQKNDKMIFSI